MVWWEIAFPVEQAHRDEGNTEVAGGLAVIAGEDAQAPRIDGEALVKTEFRAEIGHQVARRVQELAYPAAGVLVSLVIGVVGG